MNNQAKLKQEAALRAVEFIESGMVVGLGSGSTARFATERIGALLRQKRLQNIIAIPSSIDTENLARSLEIPLSTFEDYPQIDVTIDGADEVDNRLNLIKGGGGALLREKVLAQASRKNIIVVDESKVSEHLGETWALPIEVVPFAQRTVTDFLTKLGAGVELRRNIAGKPYLTDQQNIILDARFGPMPSPEDIAAALNRCAGIVEHGLFLGLATLVIVAANDGIQVLDRKL